MTDKRKWKRIRNFQKRNVRVHKRIERQKLFQKYLEKFEDVITISDLYFEYPWFNNKEGENYDAF